MVNSNKKVVGFGLAAAVFFIIALLVAGVAMGGDGGLADDRIEDMSGIEIEGVLAASAVTSAINYQGLLTDSSGNPLSGTYTMTFKLYENATDGTALDTDTNTVTVTDGLFNTDINFSTSYFDGQALWLGIKVGSNSEMTPRQELRPVPYALSLRPGAMIKDASFTTTAAGTMAIQKPGVNVSTQYNWNPGVLINTTGHRSDGVSVSTAGFASTGVYVNTTGESSHGVYVDTNDNFSWGLCAVTRGIMGWGVWVNTQGFFSPGVSVGTSGDSSDGVSVTTQGQYSQGVYARTYGNNSQGVSAYTTGIGSEGVYARTKGNESQGVYANTSGNLSTGVYVETDGYHSDGVYARTKGNNSQGIFAYTTGIGSEGVFVRTDGNGSVGVSVDVYGNESAGVLAHSAKSNAIVANTRREDGNYAFYTHNDNIYVGGKIELVGTVDPIIVEGFNAEPLTKYEVGDVVCLDESGTVKPCSKADDTRVVGVVGPTVELEDGELMVVIMGHQGARPDEEYVQVLEQQLERAETQKVESKLQGLGETDKNVEREITMLRSELDEAKSVTRQVVRVKADAIYGSIKAGDLLTTSATKGHAMKAYSVNLGGVEIYRPGTIIGKAMEPLNSGTGLIEVFVTLQ